MNWDHNRYVPGTTSSEVRQAGEPSPLACLPMACPLDGELLIMEHRSLRCPQGHTFDIARQGYANLLPVQFKPSVDPGDSREMVAARRRVMNAGLFEPLASEVARRAKRILQAWHSGGNSPMDADNVTTACDVQSAVIVDAGCGEGYYARAMAGALQGCEGVGSIQSSVGGSLPPVLGIDISKWAVKAAAGQSRTLAWAVANNTNLPIRRYSAALITSLFGFETWKPWSTLQATGQSVLVVQAGPRHLLELRERVYPEVRIHELPDTTAALEAGYELVEQMILPFRQQVDDESLLRDLLNMTPHGHRVAFQDVHPLHDCHSLNIAFEPVIRHYRRIT